jgi:hypothetical protein
MTLYSYPVCERWAMATRIARIQYLVAVAALVLTGEGGRKAHA